MTPVVPDASVVVGWVVDEVQSAEARRLPASGARLLAPVFLQLEVANVLIMRIRRRLPTPDGYPAAVLRELRSGGIDWTPDAELIDAAVTLARRHLHPVYDCLYLALARREEAMLATFDRRLAALATTLAIPLWSAEPSKDAP